MNLHLLSISELQKLLSEKSISSVELTKHFLSRIDRLNPVLNCYVHLNHDESLKMAQHADDLRSKGFNHPLLGIPIAHKDIICTEQFPTTCCSKILEGYLSPFNATLAQNLQNAGAVTLGKLNMDEFAMGSSNETSVYGPCKNPWDTKRVPGGSSGGSASAIAASLAVAVTGTDTGGSIRQPASFCGITGLKPTYGRVSRFGVVAFSSSLDQAGPMARTSEDCSIMLETMAGVDPKDMTSLDVKVDPYKEYLNESLEGLKIGLPTEFLNDLDSGIQKSLEESIKVFKSLGATIHEVTLPSLKYSVPTYYILAPSEASSNLARFDGVRYGYRFEGAKSLQDMYEQSRSRGFGDEVIRRILVGAFTLSSGYQDQYYARAQKARSIICRDFKQLFEQVDVILSPVSPISPYELNAYDKNPVGKYTNDMFTICANLAKLPAISFPSSQANNLPNGVQLIGNHFMESRILNMSHKFQTETEYHKSLPSMID